MLYMKRDWLTKWCIPRFFKMYKISFDFLSGKRRLEVFSIITASFLIIIYSTQLISNFEENSLKWVLTAICKFCLSGVYILTSDCSYLFYAISKHILLYFAKDCALEASKIEATGSKSTFAGALVKTVLHLNVCRHRENAAKPREITHTVVANF